MARSEARLQFGMWRAGLDGLSAHGKLMYCVLLTEPTLNHCGVGAVRMARWAKDASLTIEETDRALGELVAGGWVVLDEETEEVFVRTLIRNDNVAAQPYVLKGALREATQVESPAIRRVLAAELRKLPPKQPDGTSKRGTKVVYPDPHAAADAIDPGDPSPTPSKPSRKGSETLFEVGAPETLSKGSMEGEGVGEGDNSPSVATSVSVARSKPRADTPPTAQTKTAQELAAVYYDRVPLSNFPAILKIVKKALAAGYSPDRIRAGLHKLADEGRSVTTDGLRIAMDGPPLRAVAGGEHPAGYRRMTGTFQDPKTGRFIER